MSIVNFSGRLGNNIIIALANNIIAKKYNLYIEYNNNNYNINEIMKIIGINLFIGVNKYDKTNIINDNNYFKIFESEKIEYNISTAGYFQTKKITDMLHEYLNSFEIRNNIINNNKYKNRYNNNNDCFIHIRLGDVEKYNPGFEYYDKILETLIVDNIYLATDCYNHKIILKLKDKYKNIILLNTELSDIIIFGSTNKYVILSYGSFSAIIGYLSFYSIVYYITFCEKYAWDWNSSSECNMFLDKKTLICNWIENTL